jgi:hypothetical protein
LPVSAKVIGFAIVIGIRKVGSDVFDLFPTFVWKLQLARAPQERIANGLMAVLGEQRGRNASL